MINKVGWIRHVWLMAPLRGLSQTRIGLFLGFGLLRCCFGAGYMTEPVLMKVGDQLSWRCFSLGPWWGHHAILQNQICIGPLSLHVSSISSMSGIHSTSPPFFLPSLSLSVIPFPPFFLVSLCSPSSRSSSPCLLSPAAQHWSCTVTGILIWFSTNSISTHLWHSLIPFLFLINASACCCFCHHRWSIRSHWCSEANYGGVNRTQAKIKVRWHLSHKRVSKKYR